jgi:hypothetical protein
VIVCRDGFLPVRKYSAGRYRALSKGHKTRIKARSVDEFWISEADRKLLCRWFGRSDTRSSARGELSSQGVCSPVFFGSVSFKRPGQRSAGALLGKRTSWGRKTPDSAVSRVSPGWVEVRRPRAAGAPRRSDGGTHKTPQGRTTGSGCCGRP